MFEATFKITALVESNGQGQRVFRVVKHEAPLAGCRREAKILSRVTVVLKIRSRTVKTLASVMLWMMHLLQQRLVKQLFLSLRQTAR